LHPIVAHNCQYNRYNNLWSSYIWRCRVGEHQACIHIAYVLYILICIHTTDIRSVYVRKLLRTPLWRCAARGIQESWIRIFLKEISLRCREPATETFNKPNSEQFSLLLDTLENSLPPRTSPALYRTSWHWFYASKLFRCNRSVKGCETSLTKFKCTYKCTRACIVYVRNL